VRTRSCTVLFLFLSAFMLSAVARAEMAPACPTHDLSGANGRHPMVAERPTHLASSDLHNCENCGKQAPSGADNPSDTAVCHNALECTPEHCFSSHGLIGQPLIVVPCAAREYFTHGGYHFPTIVLAPPGRPPRHVWTSV